MVEAEAEVAEDGKGRRRQTTPLRGSTVSYTTAAVLCAVLCCAVLVLLVLVLCLCCMVLVWPGPVWSMLVQQQVQGL